MARHWLDDEKVVHCDGWTANDYTLCGDALEGEACEVLMVRTDEPINCSRCIAAVRFCKRICDSELAR